MLADRKRQLIVGDDAAPDRQLVDIKHDSARLPARRAVERMIREESKEVVAAE